MTVESSRGAAPVPSITRTCVSATTGAFTRIYALTLYPGQAGSSLRHTGLITRATAILKARTKGRFFRRMWLSRLRERVPRQQFFVSTGPQAKPQLDSLLHLQPFRLWQSGTS